VGGGSLQNSKFHLSSLIFLPMASVLCTWYLSSSLIMSMSRAFSHNQKEANGHSPTTSLSQGITRVQTSLFANVSSQCKVTNKRRTPYLLAIISAGFPERTDILGY